MAAFLWRTRDDLRGGGGLDLFVSERDQNRYQPTEERYNRQDDRPDKQSSPFRALRVAGGRGRRGVSKRYGSDVW